MPRKKKIKKEETPITKENTSSGFTYEGKVTVKVVRDNRVIKELTKRNSGATPLFFFIEECLRGRFNEDYFPNYIKALNYTNSVYKEVSQNQPIIYRDPVNSSTVRYTCIMPSTSFINNLDITHLGLYCNKFSDSDSLSGFSAIVTLEEPINPSSLGAQSSLLVEWELTIENK